MDPKKRDGLKVHGAGSARERQRAPCPPVCAKSARLRSLACALLQLAGYLCDTMKDGTDVEVCSQNELIAHAQPTSGDQSFGWGWRITKSNNGSNNNKKKFTTDQILRFTRMRIGCAHRAAQLGLAQASAELRSQSGRR